MDSARFQRHDLDDGPAFLSGTLPPELLWNDAQFEEAWALHPEVKPTIHLHGRAVMIPRWQQAYGEHYHFSGQVSRALPVPAILQPLLVWSRDAINPALNAPLLNWYEGPGHYIGPHHDSTVRMIRTCPIVTISFGETRTFRLSRGVGPEKRTLDFPAPAGTVFVLPYATNKVWKHGVPKSMRYTGRRISVTVRGFDASG